MITDALDEIQEGIQVGGQWMKSVRFADDRAMLASVEAGLQRMMENTNRVFNQYGMRINIKNTKVMKIGREQRRVHIEIEGKELEQVRHFKCLGSLLAEDVYCETEIRARVAMAKETFKPHNSLFTASLELQLKKRLMKYFVWGLFLYGSETWTLRKEDRKRIDALEI
ncbi:uncharacterized protein [Apostichopus japonicus]|uniref:uncharacterized protein n=1 Tax=Stichopus japonicus TaxID=307972 RepID=UPI003AB33B47